MLQELSTDPLCPDCKLSRMLFTGRWWECSCGAIQFRPEAASAPARAVPGPLSPEPC